MQYLEEAARHRLEAERLHPPGRGPPELFAELVFAEAIGRPGCGSRVAPRRYRDRGRPVGPAFSSIRGARTAAAALETTLTNTKLSEELRRAATRRVEAFGLESWARRFLEVLP